MLGIGGHESHRSLSVHWQTPPEILAALGAFDFDPCPLGCFTADGLHAQWNGRVWLNPPYGARMWPWIAKLADHGDGIALIFARTETEGFHEQVWKRADALFFLRGRLHFWQDGQRAKGSAGAPSVLIAYGDRNAESLLGCGLPGKFVLNQKEPNMPPKSEAQRRAMEAAAHGHSTLGIPKSVGAEFSKADPGGKLPQHVQHGHSTQREKHPDHPGSRK